MIAQFWSNQGPILEFDFGQGSEPYEPATTYSRTVTLDPTTNRALVQEMVADIGRFRINVNERLTRDGQLVAIAPPDPETPDRNRAQLLWARLNDPAALTDDEIKRAFKFLMKHSIGGVQTSKPAV